MNEVPMKSKLESIPCDGLKAKFISVANEEIANYLQLNPVRDDSGSFRSKCISKVYEFTVKIARHIDANITASSLNSIQSKFPKNPEVEPIYRDLLRLLLVEIEKETGIRAPNIGENVYIEQEVPQLTPDIFLNSQLANNIYETIESASSLHSYLDSPHHHAGFLVLWLCLKEGIDQQKTITDLLCRPESRTLISGHWFFSAGKKRYWLSTQAELLLHRWYESNDRRRLLLSTVVNTYLVNCGLLPRHTKLSFIELRQMLKLEYVMTRNAMEYGLAARKIDSTFLAEHVMTRLLSDVRVNVQRQKEPTLATTVRQTRSWDSAFSSSYRQLRPDTDDVCIMQQTTEEQITVISRITNVLIRTNRKNSIRIRQKLLTELHPKLHNPSATKKMPWAWLLLSWLYHLLKNGGKNKSTLRLDTIKAYVDYVAMPFIVEFSGCNPNLMDSLDWAEKLNDVIERISSVTKKAYVAYFAEYLVESALVPNLCLSDIDVPAAQHNVDANVITQHEADRIIEALNASQHSKASLGKIIFLLAFYTGLRRNEIAGLQFKDVYHYNDRNHTLHVRPNRYRLLKSKESSRNIPIDVLIPKDLLEVFMEYLFTAKTKFMAEDTSIFPHFEQSDIEEAFSFLTNVLKGVTGDESIRFHHCRHSFCNWMVVQLYYNELTNKEDIAFLNHHYFSEQRSHELNQRLGITRYSRKKFWAIATLLGHASPATTAASYFHLSDFLRRNLFANHVASEASLRRVWGQRISTDPFGRVTPKANFSQRLLRTMPTQSAVALHTEVFDIQTLEKPKSRKPEDDLSLELCWRVIRRSAEGHSSNSISKALELSLNTVQLIIETEAHLTERLLSNSKYQARSSLNYENLNQPNISVLGVLIRRYTESEVKLKKAVQLPMLYSCIESFIGAKDSLIRTDNKDMALTLLRFLKLMEVGFFEIKVKWYMANISVTDAKELTPYLAHVDYWIKAIVKNVELPKDSIQLVVPKQLERFKQQFEDRATTVCSDDGRFIRYNSPGTISIHFKQTKFHSDQRKSPETLPSMPRRTKAFVSFLRLVKTYWTVKEEKSE
ncbi:tyrosine-type recombinase/integrase [Vibrio halioticoli]